MNVDPKNTAAANDTSPASSNPQSDGPNELDPSAEACLEDLPRSEDGTPVRDSDDAVMQKNIPDQDIADAEMGE